MSRDEGEGAEGTGTRDICTLVITGELGLHARPAARFVKLASTFEAEIHVTCKGVTVSGRSIMGLMMLAAVKGDELTIMADGPDAEQAVRALSHLVSSGFGSEGSGGA